MGNAKAKWQVLFGIVSAVAFGIAGAVEPIGTFSRVEGYAYVIRDEGNVQAREGVRVKEGDRVFSLLEKDERITISFDDGCGYKLKKSKIFVIGPQSPCVLGEGGSYQIDPYSGISTDPNLVAMAYKHAQFAGSTGSSSAAITKGFVAGGAGAGEGTIAASAGLVGSTTTAEATVAASTAASTSSFGGTAAAAGTATAPASAGLAGVSAGSFVGATAGTLVASAGLTGAVASLAGATSGGFFGSILSALVNALGGVVPTAIASIGTVTASLVAIASTTDSGRPSISNP